MLTQLRLELFKCFETLRLPLAPLTLLSGTNASGKSSVMQALTLLHQTAREQEWSTRLLLNGGSLRLGTVADVVDKVHGRRQLGIGLADEDTVCHWSFSGERQEMSLRTDRITVNEVTVESPTALHYLLPLDAKEAARQVLQRIRRLTYIAAERSGPQDVYELDDPGMESVVGPAGESALSILYWGRDEEVLPGLLLETAAPTRLRQVEAQMARFFPGCVLNLEKVPQADAVTLGIRTSDDTDFHRPRNVGFGLTQVLPIFIAAASAKHGDLLLIENPEVHLHPAGQAQMGAFLATLADAGVQVIVETHSDHVLNGVRRSVRSGLTRPDEVAIHFFRSRIGGGSQVVTPSLDASGNLDAWPEGFFDQFDKDASFFAGWGE